MAAAKKAAEGGSVVAMSNLGFLLSERLDPPDLAGAGAWFLKAAADAGTHRAMNNLGDLLSDRLDPPDLAGARAWYEGRRGRDTRAMDNLGILLANRLDPPDLAGARAGTRRPPRPGHPRPWSTSGSCWRTGGSAGPGRGPRLVPKAAEAGKPAP